MYGSLDLTENMRDDDDTAQLLPVDPGKCHVAPFAKRNAHFWQAEEARFDVFFLALISYHSD